MLSQLRLRYDNRLNQKSGTYYQVPEKDTFICANFRNIDIQVQKSRHLWSPKEKTVADFSDGSCFKTHPLFTTKRHALQIQIYYDDFETANPLGSKCGIYKTVYFIVRNLPPKFNSVLMNIHLLSLFPVTTNECFGVDKLYGKLRFKCSIFRWADILHHCTDHWW